jgi:uncharacterized damage-inducible protein DinB
VTPDTRASAEFAEDLAECLRAVAGARKALLERVCLLTDADLPKARRGGWSLQEVLFHVIESEVAYARVIAHLRGTSLATADPTPQDVTSIATITTALERYRSALEDSVVGVDEGTFYEIRALGRDKYSVMSVLENVADHDHEHLGQIDRTMAGAR